MACPHCPHVNPADARLCTGYGQPLARLCPVCPTSNASDSRFCKACGTSLAAFPQPDLFARGIRSAT